MTTRRSFLKVTAAAAAALGPLSTRSASLAAPVPAKGWEMPRDVRITSITSTRYAVRHPRKIGLNSFKDHGPGHTEGLVRVGTSDGVEGFGNHLDPRCLGKTLGELLDVRDGRLRLRPEARPLVNTAAESTLLDLVGKLTKRSAAELLGPVVRDAVPAYDGSIYMRDLEVGDDAIAKDVRNGLDAGHRRFKVKIGRGNWIKDRAKGYARDLWAIRTVSETAGKDGVVMVDANNYYNLEESVRLLKETEDDVPLYWMEEMFQEVAANHDDYRNLRAMQKEISPKTFLADGESGRGDGDLLELLKEGTVQVSQPDIRTLGIFAFRDYAEQLRPFGALVAPHVWAKHIGFLETIILGLAAPNFDTAEDCRLVSDVVHFPNLKIERGDATIAPAPGLGIAIDEAAYEKECAPKANRITAD